MCVRESSQMDQSLCLETNRQQPVKHFQEFYASFIQLIFYCKFYFVFTWINIIVICWINSKFFATIVCNVVEINKFPFDSVALNCRLIRLPSTAVIQVTLNRR